ncbi:predicted protein [Plenodomus lingam JN3]|uniref:Uncharacterized protein n=1 Tax=Leptosphaeria maculans (strain JN3 / isolate v23.1.3 / race Av1-4-5-6-7-8) TaxID=985895 RepID=E5A734_LEPMJ|nr:predicted protein [Plenodomus lingam JN3]CBX99429.1 predicted protein [Plenodomus lingam JN3]
MDTLLPHLGRHEHLRRLPSLLRKWHSLPALIVGHCMDWLDPDILPAEHGAGRGPDLRSRRVQGVDWGGESGDCGEVRGVEFCESNWTFVEEISFADTIL